MKIDLRRKTYPIWPFFLASLLFVTAILAVHHIVLAQDGIGIGQKVIVTTGGELLNLRQSPGTKQKIVAKLPNGTEMEVVGGPTDADGHTWWELSGSQGRGWASEKFLRLAVSGMPSPQSSSVQPLDQNCDSTFNGIQHCVQENGAVNIIKIDLNNPHIRFETVLAHDGQTVQSPTFERVAEMVKRYPGVAAAINADYFGPGHHGAQGLTIKNGVRLDGPGVGDNDGVPTRSSNLIIGKAPLDDPRWHHYPFRCKLLG